MKNFTFFWRYLALFLMLFGALSMNAQTPTPNPTATVVGDSVDVSWDLFAEDWLGYSDGAIYWIWGEATDYSYEASIKINPADMTHLDDCSLTEFSFWKYWSADANKYEVVIRQGVGATEIYREDITDDIVGGWYDYELASMVPFDNTEPLWIGIYMEADGGQSPLGSGYATSFTPDGQYLSVNGGAMFNLGYTGEAWGIYAFATGEFGKSFAVGNYEVTERLIYEASTGTPNKTVIENNPADALKFAEIMNGSRAITLWNVDQLYTINEAGVPAETLIGQTTGQIMYDSSWYNLETGAYAWKVSEDGVPGNFGTSNTLDVDMLTTVDVTVTTEYGDDPTATVTFTNTTEPDLEIEYEVTLDETGTYTFEDFRKGSYDVEVVLDGYFTQNYSYDVTPPIVGDPLNSIWEAKDYLYEMEGIAAPPTNLVATPDEIYYGDGNDVVLTWETGASSESHFYNVYRSDNSGAWEKLNVNPLAQDVLTFTDTDDLKYQTHEYAVTAAYTNSGESIFSNEEEVIVIEKGGVSGVITDLVTFAPIEGATIVFEGEDEFGADHTYTYTSDVLGEYEADGLIWDGEYDVTVSALGYTSETGGPVDILGALITTGVDFDLAPGVVATIVGDSVIIEWGVSSAEIDYFDIFRYVDLQDETVFPLVPKTPQDELIGTTTGGEIHDNAWGTAHVRAGVYSYYVVANYIAVIPPIPPSDPMFSNKLDKLMPTIVNVEVTTEYDDSPEATVTFTNTSEPVSDIEYEQTLDSTGLYTFEPFRKGTYTIDIELDGYDPQTYTLVNIWDSLHIERDFVWNLIGAASPPLNLVALEDSVYYGDNVELTWERPANDALVGYTVYRNGLPLFFAHQEELFYTDSVPPVNMDPSVYTVTATYLDARESGFSDPADVFVTGKGFVGGTVVDARYDEVIEGAVVDLVGVDEFGNIQTYTFTTDSVGNYGNDTIWAGTYDYTVTFAGYEDGESEDVVVVYDVLTTEGFRLFPAMEVTATENADLDEVTVEWVFEADATRELIDFTIYRALWDENDPAEWTNLGYTVGSIFVDTDWGTTTFGKYKWVVESNYALDTTVAFSNYIDKDMETVVDVTVVLNTGETPEGVKVKFLNIGEPELDSIYQVFTDATGKVTFNPFRKGEYAVTISKFGYTAQYPTVIIDDSTSLTYLLEEELLPVDNLFVDPSGFATWEVAVEGFAQWLFYHGSPYYTWYGDPWSTAMKFDPVQLKTFDGGSVTKVSVAFGDVVEGGKIQIFEGPNAATLLYEQDLTDMDDYSWNEVELTTPVPINIDKQLWISIYNPAGTDIFSDDGSTPNSNGDWYTEDGETWDNVGGYNWAIECFVTDIEGKSVALGGITNQNVYADAPHNGLTKTESDISIGDFDRSVSNTESNRSFSYFKVMLDNIFHGDTENLFYDYEASGELVEGTEYSSKVFSYYTTGISDTMEYIFVYHACDYYDSVSNFTAARVDGTMDIALAWTNDTVFVGDVFDSTRIYRNGVLLESIARGTEIFTDPAVASGTYTYCVTQFYESKGESCEVCAVVVMTDGGYVNGYVTDFGSGDSIAGAYVTVSDSLGSFAFTTDSTGYYSGEVAEGTYTYTVVAADYAAETLEGVLIEYGATVTNNFALKEFPYPVGSVLAWQTDDDVVQVSWDGSGPPVVNEWISYDDGTNTGNLGTTSAFTIAWANKFEPSQLVSFIDCAITDMQYYGYNGGVVDVISVMIYSGGDTEPATLLYTEDVTDQVLNGDEWNDIVLAEAVPFDNSQSLWFGFYAEASDVSYPSSMGPQLVPTTNADWYSFNAGAWTNWNDGTAWNIHAFVTSEFGERIALNPQPATSVGNPNLSGTLVSVQNMNPEASRMSMDNSSRAVAGYNVFRGPCDGEAVDMVFLGYTVDQEFTDNTWGTADPGIFTWAVEVAYDYNVSEFTYSNCLDKDMITEVSVDVITNSGDSPEGTEVMFTNVSEDTTIVFETILDNTGMYTWTAFRKGTYDIFIHLNGFEDINVDTVDIWDVSVFEFILQEMIPTPVDLYVNPMGYATWSADVADGDRELDYYKVWLDGAFSADVETEFYQFGDSGEELLPGTTYNAEVAAIYSTGISGKVAYEFTYLPCDSFPAPADIFTENIVGTKDVLVKWSDIPPPPPAIVVDETFEVFTANEPLAQQAEALGIDYWTTWSGAVGGTEDPMVSDAQAFEGSNSMLIEQDNDCVLLLDTYTEGAFLIDFEVYIPTDKVGYFNVLQRFGGAGTTWGTQTYFNAGGAGLVDAGGAGTGVFTYDYDTWNNVLVGIDLDNDYAEMYFNGNFIVSWVWSTGAFGSNDLLEFNAMNFYGASADDGAFFDNIFIVRAVDGKSSRNVTESTGTNVYRDDVLIAFVAVPDTMYTDMALTPGIYEYCVAKVYMDTDSIHTWTSCDLLCEDAMVPEDCIAPVGLTAVLDDETFDAVNLNWNTEGVVFITQNPGEPYTGLYQDYGYGYGVVYDLSSYPDALANSIEFHHTSWGVYGPFDYNIHIIDFDTYETIATLGPFTTTGDDTWELDIALGDVNLLGASTVGFLMEPLSNDPADAYPDISMDGAVDPQGSVVGPLDDLAAIGSNAYGNILMNIYITTENGIVVMAPRAIDLPVAESAVPRIGSGNVANGATINQTAISGNSSREFMGYNIYRDGEVIEEMVADNFYTDTDGLVSGNIYCYEVTAMYAYCGESDFSNEACTDMYVGLGELNENEVSLYPNPASNRVNVTSTYEMTRLTVTNYVGQVVYASEDAGTRVELNTNSYQAGVYLVKIETESGVVTKRVIIRR